jgi:hypothetical protein
VAAVQTPCLVCSLLYYEMACWQYSVVWVCVMRIEASMSTLSDRSERVVAAATAAGIAALWQHENVTDSLQ